jgi:hypothetical protein
MPSALTSTQRTAFGCRLARAKGMCIRHFFLILCFELSSGCKTQNYTNEVSVSINRDTFSSGTLAKKSSVIFFESDFDSAIVLVRQGNQVIFDSILNTDDRSGFANSITIENNMGLLEIVFNEKVIHIEDYYLFSYIRVLYWQNGLKIILTNTKPFFK